MSRCHATCNFPITDAILHAATSIFNIQYSMFNTFPLSKLRGKKEVHPRRQSHRFRACHAMSCRSSIDMMLDQLTWLLHVVGFHRMSSSLNPHPIPSHQYLLSCLPDTNNGDNQSPSSPTAGHSCHVDSRIFVRNPYSTDRCGEFLLVVRNQVLLVVSFAWHGAGGNGLPSSTCEHCQKWETRLTMFSGARIT